MSRNIQNSIHIRAFVASVFAELHGARAPVHGAGGVLRQPDFLVDKIPCPEEIDIIVIADQMGPGDIGRSSKVDVFFGGPVGNDLDALAHAQGGLR